MFVRTRLTLVLYLLIRLAVLLLLVSPLALSCITPSEPEEPPLAVLPLVLLPPYFGDETEIRDPFPQPERIWLKEESVEGWVAPIEGKLRFPVQIRENARLSFRLGSVPVSSDISIEAPELVVRVEYHPTFPLEVESGEEPPSPVIYELTQREILNSFHAWIAADISLEDFTPSGGELHFIVEGLEDVADSVKVFWGHPTVYHPRERRFRNVLLIGVDTLRADALSIYGGLPEVSPGLQAFSERSTVFDQARSQSSWTLPSFASMITGRLPSSIGATVYTGHLPERANTIGEKLRSYGYATETICTNPWLGNNQSGFEQGMDALWYRDDAEAQAAVHRAYDFITRSMSRDWFCFIHLIDPHAPFDPPRRILNELGDPSAEGPYRFSFNQIDDWKTLETPPPDNEIQQVLHLYNGEVLNVDTALKDLFEFLVVNGLDRNTLVIVASDHGEEFFDHGGFEHGHTLYDELVRMPLIIHGGDFPEGERIDSSVGNTDLFPTILEYADIDVPEGLPGIPLQQYISGDAPGNRFIFGEGNTRGTHKKFVVEWPYKCIMDYVLRQAVVYDLENDPGETIDIHEDNPELTYNLAEAIAGTMLPDQTAFHVWITISYSEEPKRFTGTLRIPGGIENVQDFLLTDDDHYTVDDNTITFDFSSRNDILGLYRHLLIVPADDSEILEVEVLIDGEVAPNRFFPYGNSTPEPSGSVTVEIDDFPLGPELPQALEGLPAACYIWGVRGYSQEYIAVEHDPITQEQLDALGYVQ